MWNAEMVGLTTTKSEMTFKEMLYGIRDDLRDLASSDDGEDWEDKDVDEEDSELGKLSEDDEPGWMMGAISKTVQYCMERVWQTQMQLEELTHPGWGDAANYFCESDKMDETNKWNVLAVIQLRTEVVAASSALTTFCEPTETLASVHRNRICR